MKRENNKETTRHVTLTKTKIMLFGNNDQMGKVAINNRWGANRKGSRKQVPRIIIDDQISWKPHIKYIQTKL